MIHDTLIRWTRYFHTQPWRTAFEYLASLDAHAPEGRVALRGETVYAIVMSYDTGGPEDSVLETHDEHIDIQMSLLNAEGIDWHPRESLEIHAPYDPDNDRTFYKRPDGPCTRVYNSPGRFAVLFPDDAHMPKQAVNGNPVRVKKVVVKLHRSTLAP